MSMFILALILTLSTGLLFFYLQFTCQRILRRNFDREYFRAVVNANCLEFPSVNQSLRDLELPADYSRLLTALKMDFLVLTFLLENAPNPIQPYSWKERLLIWYFKLVFLSLILRHWLGRRDKPALWTLTAILQYLANVLGRLENASTLNQRYLREEQLLMLYFLLVLSVLTTLHWLR
jgi:hypothetical protein